MLLEGKICLVTGANRGIGRAIAYCFAKEGAIVYCVARKEGSLDGLEQEVLSFAGIIHPLYFDIRDMRAQKAAVMRIKKEQGVLDVLVNNAGIMRDAVIGMIDHSQMEDTFETNVFAMINLIQISCKLMKRQGYGSIINMASIIGVEGNANEIVYSASKGAVIALTKSAAKELAPEGIRVNAVAPGIIETDMFRSVKSEKAEKMISQIGMGRVGTPMDVANTCLFLASDLSVYVTGQIIGVDGAVII